MPKMTVPPDQRSKALQYYHANREARKAKTWMKDSPELLRKAADYLENSYEYEAPAAPSPAD